MLYPKSLILLPVLTYAVRSNLQPPMQRHLTVSDYPTEYGCPGSEYKHEIVVNYSYSMETSEYIYTKEMTMSKYIAGIINNFEGELLIKLSEDLLSCNSDNGLGIVEISSLPKDKPAEKRCTSTYDDCTVINGSLQIFVDSDKYLLPKVREAALSVISNTMTNSHFTKPFDDSLVQDLRKLTYRGPAYRTPNNLEAVDSSIMMGGPLPSFLNDGEGKMTSALIVIVVGSMMGLLSAFVLIYRSNRNKQRSMASSTGNPNFSHGDDDFNQSRSLSSLPVLPLGPEDHNLFGENDEDEDEDDMEVVNYDLANGGLSAVENDTWEDNAYYGHDDYAGRSPASKFQTSTIRMRQTP